jgi:ketosteroid isomerase-like protein
VGGCDGWLLGSCDVFIQVQPTRKGVQMNTTAISTESTFALITRFENGFNARDIDALMADMTEDCVFEHVAPASVSFGRHEGQAAVRAVWESLDAHFPNFTMEVLDIFAAGNRGACRWVMRWPQADGSDGELRGVDVFTVRDGKIAEKLTYGTL